MELLEFQKQALDAVKGRKACAFYHEMGLGKTFTGTEQLMRYNATNNLIICQVSKVDDWVNHVKTNYDVPVYDLTKARQLKQFLESDARRVGVINYDKIARRPELGTLTHIALLLDESSMIKNFSTARTKTIMKFSYDYLVLLSGTPMGGKYEELWTQCRMLGWHITNQAFLDRYTITKEILAKNASFPVRITVGYKNIDELKQNLRQLGAHFLRTQDVIDLPEQVFQTLRASTPVVYNKFNNNDYLKIEGQEFIGDSPTKRLLYSRMIASIYNPSKVQIMRDILDSTTERLVIFYNFRAEFALLCDLMKQYKRPVAYVNGDGKDLQPFIDNANGVCLCQSQSGAMGINLQLANKLIVFSPTLSGENFMQMLKRIHRLGQKQTCFYYLLSTNNTVEENIYDALQRKQDYTLDLFILHSCTKKKYLKAK